MTALAPARASLTKRDASTKRMQRSCRKQLAVVQLSAVEALVSALHSECSHVLTSTTDIKGVDVWDQKVLLWKAASAEVYAFEASGMELKATFSIAEGSTLMMHHSYIFQIWEGGLKALTLEGAQSETLFKNEPSDKACNMDVCDGFLVLVTSKFFVHMWEISDSSIKLYGPRDRRRIVIDSGDADIHTVRCNCDARKVSFLINSSGPVDGDPRLFIYDSAYNNTVEYSFRSANTIPCSHYWDAEEPKLLACETCPIATSDPSGKKLLGTVTTFFVDYANDIYIQDKVKLDDPSLGLLGVHVPYLYLVRTPTREEGTSSVIQRQTISDFWGMESADQKTKAALLEYSYHICADHIDAPYKSLRAIEDPEIWKKVARTCVRSKRIDVALYCFGKMKRASAAAFVRAGLEDLEEEEAKVARIALQLNLKDEAARLYVECGRYDLLNQLYQMCGDWEKAIEVATEHDRVHLKNTHHAYAKHFEAMGNIQAAIQHYELSETHRYEVPRMLYSGQQLEELHVYIDNSSDPVLQRWWAHYCEANSDLPNAIAYYKAAGDTTSLVRVYCLQNNFSAAAAAVKETSHASAAFYLGRQYEKIGNVPLAIQFFGKAGKYSYAAELAMKYGVDSELLALSLQSPKDLMLASARYFEAKAMYEESVLLYQKGGDLEKAVDVCFSSQLFNALKAIADDLDEGADPALLARCGDFLMEHKQVEKAVQLFIAAKKYDHALDLCVKEGVKITERMADLFPVSKEGKRSEDSTQLLLRIAECCQGQGSYHLACKKYAQAGERVKAMQALLKSCDTERIIFFANVSRHKQIYVLAANYLQSLDWHQDASIMKHIVQMYTKAGEMTLLASFHDSCAQLEIDEYRDYEKALGAMKEALKHLLKSDAPNRDEKVKSLQRRTLEVERFVQIRRMAKSDPAGMVKGCSDLLAQLSQSPNFMEAAVRIGDLYALLIEFYHSQGNMEQAYITINLMLSRKIALGPYVDPVIVESVYQANGVQVMPEETEDGIDEEIVTA